MINEAHHKSQVNDVPLNIHVYTFCYNEKKLIPFALQYWQKFAAKVIVYDNGSTDGSIEALEAFNHIKNDFIEIRHFVYPRGIDDFQLQNMKNNIWKESRYVADFVCVCDMDEFLYTDDIVNVLQDMKSSGATIIKPQGINLFSFNLPKYDGIQLMHEIINRGALSDSMSKCVLFNPNEIQEIGYDPGCHVCHPVGNVVYYTDNKFFLYHAKYLSLNYLLDRYHMSKKKLSKVNIDNKFGVQYTFDDDTLKEQYMNVYNKSGLLKGEEPSRIQFTQSQIIHSCPVENNSCIIVVPIYNVEPNSIEIASLKQVVKMLGDNYRICLVAPDMMDIRKYFNEADYDFDILYLNSSFFESKMTYNELCQRAEFYECFKEFKYMLIYQLDAFVFSNRLQYFIEKDYDYIGAPHMVHENDFDEAFKETNYTIGNGGFSLRKISKFIDICRNNKMNYNIYEDVFFSKYYSYLLKLPPLSVGFDFSIQEEKEKNISKLGHLPFGCHYYMWDNFWLPKYKELAN
jgi:glycosyltransferase involved in cell wall biosynthesis